MDSQSLQYLLSGCGWTHRCGDVMITAEQSELSEVEVDYITLPGCNSKIAGVTLYDELPINAKYYIVKIQKLTGPVVYQVSYITVVSVYLDVS